MEQDIARQAYISGLRELAALLESTPELPTPHFSNNTIWWSEWEDASGVARLASLVPGVMRKNDPSESGYDETYYRLTSDVKFGPFTLEVCSYRSTVCERVQTGVETVVVPAVEASPERVEEVPTFKYVCSPLLAKALA